ncbi:TatD family hydrolase [Candidatus Saccharibacteria bacterium]|nr:TatD family hydrolase [Candidatus Saccharibacteria bacterium]
MDTHCHIHFSDYKSDPDQVISEALNNRITKMICVGCTLDDSRIGVEFVSSRDNCWATIGLHPHEAKKYKGNSNLQEEFTQLVDKPKVVAIGETGLDFYYNNSPKNAQISILEFQLELAQKNNLPVIFHVRDAFDDFWPIFDNFKDIRGVIHSFSSNVDDLDNALSRGLHVGLNGIMTFAKDDALLDAAKAVPLQKLLLETDAPFLTPVPFRGTICEPKHVRVTAEFLANLRGESLEELAAATCKNAQALFNI